ncbi:MAG: hypothetical protein VCF24_10100 [Candidatus Latescibacterota bacterium]
MTRMSIARPLLHSLLIVAVLAIRAETAPFIPTHPDPLLEEWRWRSFHELKGKGLRCLAEGMDGSMWFGVDAGVERYDGVHWTSFTHADGLQPAPVRTLLSASDGSIYAGSERGLDRFIDGRWAPVLPAAAGLPWPTYDLIETADGTLWAATAWGACELRFTTRPCTRPVPSPK